MCLSRQALASQMALLALLPGILGTPISNATALPGPALDKRGCSHSNSGTHCQDSTKGQWFWGSDAQAALRDLLAQCDNGNLAGGAKRVASASYNGVVAYACNGFCRSQFMPCQDVEWSINRAMNGCHNQAFGQPYEGWDSQETRGTWYGLAHDSSAPCGYDYAGRGATYP